MLGVDASTIEQINNDDGGFFRPGRANHKYDVSYEGQVFQMSSTGMRMEIEDCLE